MPHDVRTLLTHRSLPSLAVLAAAIVATTQAVLTVIAGFREYLLYPSLGLIFGSIDVGALRLGPLDVGGFMTTLTDLIVTVVLLLALLRVTTWSIHRRPEHPPS